MTFMAQHCRIEWLLRENIQKVIVFELNNKQSNAYVLQFGTQKHFGNGKLQKNF